MAWVTASRSAVRPPTRVEAGPAGGRPSSTGRPAGGPGWTASTRPVRSTTAVPALAGTAATGTRSTTVMVTVAGQWRSTWAPRIQGMARRRAAAPPVSTSNMAIPLCTPEAAVTSAGVVRTVPVTRTWSTSRNGERVAAHATRATRKKAPRISSTRRRRRPSVRRTSMRRCRNRGSMAPSLCAGRPGGRGGAVGGVLTGAPPSAAAGEPPRAFHWFAHFARSRCARPAREPDESQLRFESNAHPLLHQSLHLLDQRQHVVGRTPLIGLKEVRMLWRHVRGSHAVALESGGVDEAAGAVAWRVGEHRAGVGTARLVLPPPPHDLGDLGFGFALVALAEGEGGAGDDVVAPYRRCAVAEGEVVLGDLSVVAGAEVDEAGTDHRLADIGSVPACVHTDSPADRARHADGPLQARETRGGRAPGEHRQAHGASRPHPGGRQFELG